MTKTPVRQVQWLQLDPAEFETDGEQMIKGVVFHISISPYDIPQAVRGRYDEQARHFVIEFKYLSMESTCHSRVDEHVVLKLGEKSGRIYSIHADVQAMEVEAVLLRIDHLIDEAFRGHDKRHVKTNYEVAKRIISDKAPQLWQAAPNRASQEFARA